MRQIGFVNNSAECNRIYHKLIFVQANRKQPRSSLLTTVCCIHSFAVSLAFLFSLPKLLAVSSGLQSLPSEAHSIQPPPASR